MDITNQLIAGLEKTSTTLDSLDAGLATLAQSVNRFSEISSAAAEKERQAEEAKAKADERKKARAKKAAADSKRKQAREKELARLTKEERTIKAAALKFNRKYNKEIEKIQNKFSSTISFASKVQKGIIDANKKYNVELRESVKNHIQNNKALVSFKKSTTLFSAGLTVATQKLKNLPGVAAAGRGVSAIGRGVGQGAKQAAGAIGGIAGKIGGLLPLAGILAVPGLLIRQLMKVDEAFAQIATDTGLTGKNLQFVQGNVEKATASTLAFGISLEDNAKTAAALTDALGNSEYVTDEMIEKMSMLSKATGMSSQEAGELAKTLVKGFGATAADVESFTNNMMNFASTSGVNARKVMRDISNDSNLTSIYLGRGEDYLMKSAVLAAKMGKSLSEQNATLDAFSTIESAIENVAEINIRTGANLDAQKMFMMFQTQDIQGAMRELQQAFSSPRAQAMLERYPGAFKEIAAALNLSIGDLKQLDRVMRDFEKTSGKSSAEQDAIKAALNDSSTIMDDIKNIMLQVLLPAFNNLGKFIREQIKPALNSMKESASNFGRELQKAMAGEQTFVGKVSAAFRTIIRTAKPLIKELFDEVMIHLRPQLEKMVDYTISRFRQGMGLIGQYLFGSDTPAKPREGTLRGQAEEEFGTVSVDAMGRVHKRPTLALIGEEGRSEVVIPTERIRKGMPVNPSVAAELSSIGVPGFANGGEAGGGRRRRRRLTASALDLAVESRTNTAQNNAIMKAIDDPQYIKELDASLERQNAEYRKTLRDGIKDIHDGLKDVETAIIITGPDGSALDPDGRGGGGPTGPGGGALDDYMRQQQQADLESSFYKYAKMLDNVMEVLDYTIPELISDTVSILPHALETAIRADYEQISEGTRKGVEAGTQAAWEKYIATGNFDKTVQEGFAVGFMKASEINKATFGGFLQQITGTAFRDTKSLDFGDLLGGQNLTDALGRTLVATARDKDSFVGGIVAEDEANVKRIQNAEIEKELLIDQHYENTKNAERLEKDYLEARDARNAHARARTANMEAGRELALEEDKNVQFQKKLLEEMEKNGVDEGLVIQAQNALNKEQERVIAEHDKIFKETHAQIRDQLTADAKLAYARSEAAQDALKNTSEKVIEQGLGDQIPDNFADKQLGKLERSLGSLRDSFKGLFKGEGEAFAGLKSGAITGAARAFQAGGGVKDMATTAVAGGVGKMAGTAIGTALTPFLGPAAPFVGNILGSKLGSFVGKKFGGLFGGEVIKPKKAREKIQDVIAGSLMGIQSDGMQLSNNFRDGSANHRIIQAHILHAASKDPDKLYDNVSNLIFDASGIRYSRDKTKAFIHALYGRNMGVQERIEQLDAYEREMEGRQPMRAGASGAIVSRPTVALIGEAGPEALVPLENAPGARPLNGVGSDNGELLQEIKRMNQMLGAMANRPITLDGQRVNAVLNAANSDDIRAGIYTVNSR